MKYVKIYDSKGQCQGVADIEQNYDKAGYAKLFDSNMHIIGFVDVDNIPESGDNMPVVKVFDENMQPCGVVTADNIRHSDGYLIRLQKDPSTTGAVTGGGRFIAGTSVTVVATPDAQSEYPEFDGWYEGATKVSENVSYTFTVSGARTLVAKFKATPIAPSGGLQIFANPECTRYATGSEQTVYCRFNENIYISPEPAGSAGSYDALDGKRPTAELMRTGTAFSLILWKDWVTSEVNAIHEGDILAAINTSGATVDNPSVIMSYGD